MILLYIHDMIYERPEPEFAVVRGIDSWYKKDLYYIPKIKKKFLF